MTDTKKPRRNKPRKYSEGEIAIAFNLLKLDELSSTLHNWLNTHTTLDIFEEYLFKKILKDAKINIVSWNEEELKMYFISYIIDLSNLRSSKNIRSFFERTIDAEVEGIYLKTKTDFMIAKGLLDVIQNPYFHFQEYKKDKDPNGDPLGQLLEAFLIAQAINKNDKPMYGAYIIGRLWYFVTMEGKEYCVSKAFDSTEEVSLMQIIAVLRHFKIILETKLMVD
ncbi:MAG: hypothetical protein RL344_1417 [Pseudomonadota bacterium]|jgi:hypothetical protein